MTHTSLSIIPDEILTDVSLRLPSATDVVRLGGICKRLRHLTAAERKTWKRFESIKVYCDGDIRIRGADGSIVCQFSLSNETKLRSVLRWLFAVCKPNQLQLFVFHNQVEALVQALTTDLQLHPKRLKIHLELYHVEFGELELSPLPKNPAGSVSKLLQHLVPQSLTHLHLHLQTGPTIKRIFADWMRQATRLQAVVANSDTIGVIPRLATLSQLKAVGFGGRMNTKLLQCDDDEISSLSHICGAHPTPTVGKWCGRMSARLRFNIVSFCCIDFFNPFDAESPAKRFPNCRRIEFRGELSAEQLNRICTDYRRLQADVVGEKGKDGLKISLYVDPSKEQVVEIERRSLVQIDRRRRYGYNHCAIRREFD